MERTSSQPGVTLRPQTGYRNLQVEEETLDKGHLAFAPQSKSRKSRKLCQLLYLSTAREQHDSFSPVILKWMAKAISLTLDVRPGEAKQQRCPGFLPTALGSPGAERTKESEEIRTHRKGWWSPLVGNEDI